MSIIIQKVKIWNFRSIKEASIELDPNMTVLVGANNSGKTNFLRALQLVLGTSRRFVEREDIYVKENENLPRDRSAVIDVCLVPVDRERAVINSFDDKWTEHWGDLIQGVAEGKQYVGIRTRIYYDDQHAEYVIQQCSLKKWPTDFSDSTVSKNRPVSRKLLEVVPLEFMDAQRDLCDDIVDRSSFWRKMVESISLPEQQIKEIEKILNEINENIVNSSEALRYLKEKLELLTQTINSPRSNVNIAPLTRKVRDLSRGVDVHLQSSDDGGFPLSYQGMGTRSWATLLTFHAFVSQKNDQAKNEQRPYHSVLALEEPESHLHPHAQRHVFEQLNRIPGQKIISTHSPYIASQSALGNLRRFCCDGTDTVVSRIDVTNLNHEDLRKISREVLNTRGELLFSHALVLFEGETEEQALPIFAEAYYGKHPNQLGISFIGVNGYGGYLPFLRVARDLSIDWFIFSDGEDHAKSSLNNALRKLGLSEYHSINEIVIMDNGEKFETHLVSSGYRDELQEAIKQQELLSAANQHHRVAIEEKWKVQKLTDNEILKTIESERTKYGPVIAEMLVKLPDEGRRFPPKIKELFFRINSKLNLI